MAIKNFPIWLEQREQEEELKMAIKAVASTSDENAEPLVDPDAQDGEWLGKSTANLTTTQKDSLVNLGIIKQLTPSEQIKGVQDAIRSGISFKDLVDMIVGQTYPSDVEVGDSPPPPPEAGIPDRNIPQPSQEF